MSLRKKRISARKRGERKDRSGDIFQDNKEKYSHKKKNGGDTTVIWSLRVKSIMEMCEIQKLWRTVKWYEGDLDEICVKSDLST